MRMVAIVCTNKRARIPDIMIREPVTMCPETHLNESNPTVLRGRLFLKSLGKGNRVIVIQTECTIIIVFAKMR